MGHGKTLSLVALGVAALMLSSACSAPKLTGQIVSDDTALKPVTKVSINDGTLRIVQGSPTRLTVRTDRAVKKYLVTRQKDGDLELGLPDDSDVRAYIFPRMPKDAPIEFILTTDSLDTIHLGGGTLLIDGFKTDSLLLDANLGTATLANIDVDEWRCVMVGGVADVTVAGVAGLKSSTNSVGAHYDDSGLLDR